MPTVRSSPLPTSGDEGRRRYGNMLEIEFEHESNTGEVDVRVGIDDAVWAQDTIDAFRALGDCEAAAISADQITVIEPETIADDAVILDVTFSGVGVAMRGDFLVAGYEDLLVGVAIGVEVDSPVDVPSVAQLLSWADSIAASSCRAFQSCSPAGNRPTVALSSMSDERGTRNPSAQVRHRATPPHDLNRIQGDLK